MKPKSFSIIGSQAAKSAVEKSASIIVTVCGLVAVLAVVLMNRTRTSEKTSGGRREEGR